MEKKSKFGGIFHFYHLVSFFVSINAYLFSTFINSTAAQWGFSFSEIGFINLLLSFLYALSSITLGHIGYKFRYKKMMNILFIYLFALSFTGFFVNNRFWLYIFASLQGIFFGAFFPQVEGLIAQSESLLKVTPPSITGRFTLAWSSGNIFGVAFGPYLTVKARSIIFFYGIILSIVVFLLISRDKKINGELINFTPNRKLTTDSDKFDVVKDISRMKRLRLEYRIILFLGGLIYTSVLAEFPKLIKMAGLDISRAGFLTVGANIGVLLTFIALQYWKKWVGNEIICGVLLSVVLLTGVVALFAKTPLLFFLTAFLAGGSYAVPYTFAIFYGLLSTSEEHGKQGALHEMVIGLLFGVGPFVGGIFLDHFKSTFGLTFLSIILSILIYSIQFFFNKSKVVIEK
ncbi:MAG: MFS transporter [Fervidobacterium nodosum]